MLLGPGGGLGDAGAALGETIAVTVSGVVAGEGDGGMGEAIVTVGSRVGEGLDRTTADGSAVAVMVTVVIPVVWPSVGGLFRP